MDDFVGTSSDSVPPAVESDVPKAPGEGDYTPPSLLLTEQDFAKLGVGDPSGLAVGQEYTATVHFRVSGMNDDGGGALDAAPGGAGGGRSVDLQVLKVEGLSGTGEQHSPGGKGVDEEQAEGDESPDEKEGAKPETSEDKENAGISKAVGYDFAGLKKSRATKPTPKLSAKDLQ